MLLKVRGVEIFKIRGGYTVDYKLKINFQPVEVLEERGWFDIAANRAYYYIYQTFLHYKETKNLEWEFLKFKKSQYKVFGRSKLEHLLGSHEIMDF